VRETIHFLAGNIGWLMHRPEALEARDELKAATTLIRTVIDTPPAQSYAGPCDVCGQDMYARIGADVVACRPCNLEWDMDDRRKWLLEQVDDRLARASEVCRAVAAWGGEHVTRQRINGWVATGRLAVHGHDPRGNPLYRVGDVVRLVETLGPSKTRSESG